MQKKYKNKEVILLALSDESLATVSSFVKKNNINYIVGTDAKPTFKKFGARGYPTIFVIDAKGTVAYRGSNPEAATKSLEKTLKDKPSDPEDGGLEEAAAKAAFEKALELYKKKDYAKALKALEQITKEYKDTEIAKKAAVRIKRMKADKKIMEKIREAEEKKRCETWLETARNLAQNGKRAEAAEYYQKIIDEYPYSSFADIAKTELAGL